MVDLYSPTQLVQVANAEDVQKKLNALFTSLGDAANLLI